MAHRGDTTAAIRPRPAVPAVVRRWSRGARAVRPSGPSLRRHSIEALSRGKGASSWRSGTCSDSPRIRCWSISPSALIPLCAVGAIVIVVSASWRQRIGWVVVMLAGVAVVASQLAASSGEEFQEALDKESELIHRHAELGETFVWFAIAFFDRTPGVDDLGHDAAPCAGRSEIERLEGARRSNGGADPLDRRRDHRVRRQLPGLPGGSLRREGRVVGGCRCVRWVVEGIGRMRAPPR